MRPLDPEKYALQKSLVLDAATACFAERGFHRASTDAICEKAGISAGKLFHYFPTKNALVLAVIEAQNLETAQWLGELEAGPNPAEAMIELIHGIFELAGDAMRCKLILEIAAEVSRNPEAGRLGSEGDRLLADGLSRLLTKAISLGLAKPVVSVPHLVNVIMALIDGIFSRVASDAGFDSQAEQAAFTTVVVSILGMTGGQHRE